MPADDRLANVALADALERLGLLLGAAGASPYAARAYRRAADLVRDAPFRVADLVREGRVRDLRGIGAGIEARLVELVETGAIAELAELEERVGQTALRRARRREPRRGLLLNRALALSESVAGRLDGTVAGHPRRRRELSTRLAVVVAAEAPGPVLDAFAALPEIVTLVEREAARAVGVSVDGIPLELVVAPPRRFGTELFRATGSKAYVEALEPLPDVAGEDDLYRALGLSPRPPELREQPTREPPPDDLLELERIRGDLHVHSDASDGKASVEEMARAAAERGYEYLAICDHTTNVRVVPGLDADAVRRQGEEIARVNELLAPFRVLRGIECDVLPDGSLDLPDDVLAELDWVQLSLHAGQRAPRDELTARVVEGMRHPAVSCLSHPKGRLLNHRRENDLDLDRVFEVALETGVALEVNGLPDRLDLSGEHVARAVAAGVSIVCSTDAHSVRGLGNMALAVWTARRGAATAADVVNTRSLQALPRRGT